MKKIIYVLILMLCFSCKEKIKTEDLKEDSVIVESKTVKPSNKEAKINTNDSVNEIKEIIESKNTSYKPIEKITENNFSDRLGYYVGEFVMISNDYKESASYSNLINISIDAITKDSIFGHSIVAGNIRPFRGEFDVKSLNAKVKEPGDDKYDGFFEFKLKTNNITGKWFANDKNITVNSRKYSLQKMDFEYNPDFNLKFEEGYSDMILSEKHGYNIESGEHEKIDSNNLAIINASNQLLKNKDIENLNKGELEVLRNLIYARHGYSFKNRKMRYFFDSNVDWYIPTSTDVRSKLTEIEKQNIDLIKRYEQHAERYYDYFGR